jgi:hypothetical protein
MAIRVTAMQLVRAPLARPAQFGANDAVALPHNAPTLYCVRECPRTDG